MCLIAALSAAPSPAGAQERPLVVVGESAEAPLVRELRRALDRRDRPTRVVRTLEAEPMDAFASELAVAEREYANLHPAGARRRALELIERADATGGQGVDRELLLRTMLLIALCAGAEGDSATADRAVDRALAIDPELAIDLTQHPPTLADRVQARRAALGEATGVLELRVRPPGAEVVVDGTVRANTGRMVLPVGAHVVRVRAAGWQSAGRRIEIGESPVALELSLVPEAHALVLEVGGTRAALRDVDARRTARTEYVRGRERAAADALVRALFGGGVRPPDPASAGWVPWAIAGGVAVAAAIVVSVILVASARGDRSQVEVWLDEL